MWTLQRKVTAKVFTTNNFKLFSEQVFRKSRRQLGLSFIESVVGHAATRLVTKPYFKFFWWCMPCEYRLKHEVRLLTSVVDKISARRLSESEAEIAPRSDIISLFIKKARELGAAEVEDKLTKRNKSRKALAPFAFFNSPQITTAMLVLPPSPASSSLPTLVASALLAVALSWLAFPVVAALRRKMRIAAGLKPIPGPRGWPLLGLLPDILRHASRVHEFTEDLMIEHGGRMKQPWSLFDDGAVWLDSPTDVQHILATNHDNYVRAKRFIGAVGRVFDKSFLGLNHAHTPDGGAMLKLQRKVGVKVFTTTNFRVFTDQVFHKYANKMVELVKAKGGKCDMHEISSQYTLQAIFDIACGVPLEEVDSSLGLSFIKAMDYVFAYLTERLTTKPYFKYFWWCMPSEYEMKRNEQVMINLAESILSKRLEETDDKIAPRSDIMSLFIKKAREMQDSEAASILDVETLRAIFLSFIFAGKDTSSSVITYTFYALAQYPEVQQKLLEELQAYKADNGAKSLTFDDIKKLPYLDAVVNETMRLYPTLPFGFKVAAEDDYLPDGTFIPAGTEMIYTPWYMGRHNPIFGENREVFRPERWLEMKTRPSAYDFPVFQGGPRICIGMNMAVIEVRLFIAVMVREFHVAIQEGEQVKDRGYILCPTLTMDGGLPLQLTTRA